MTTRAVAAGENNGPWVGSLQWLARTKDWLPSGPTYRLIEARGHRTEEQDGPAIRIRTPHNARHLETSCIWRDELEFDRRADGVWPARPELRTA